MITIFKNYQDTKNPIYMPIEKVLNGIKDCKAQALVDKLKSIVDAEERRQFKKTFPCILFSGTFSERRDSALLEHSGFVVLDWDGLDDVEAKKEELKQHLFLYAIFKSPSGDGLKAIARIPADKQKHRGYYNGLVQLFPDLDSTSKNESRICYTAVDSEIYINTEAVEFTVFLEDKKFSTPTATVRKAINTNYSKINVALEMIRNSSDGDKHATLLRASKLMGGYIAGGDVEEIEAVRLLEMEIDKKDITDFKGAQKTIQSGIEYGKMTPISTVREEIRNEIAYTPKSSGIKRADDALWQKMRYSFENGKERGTTTHFPKLDANFTWKRGDISLIIGHPNFGKSEFILQLMLAKAVFDNWKWGVFSPENYPEDEFYDQLIHAYIGKTTDPYYKEYQMSISEYERGYKFIKDHFFYIYPEELHTIDELEARFISLIETENINGTFIDPYNQVVNNLDMRDDQQISKFLRGRKSFSKKYMTCDVISAHPKGIRRNKNGKFDRITIHDIAGGAMWGNMMDNIMIIDRPNFYEDKMDTSVVIDVHKIKKQKLVGIPGECEFDYNRRENRYYCEETSPFGSKMVKAVVDEAKYNSGQVIKNAAINLGNGSDFKKSSYINPSERRDANVPF